ncbi:MAG TPA: hypothetical protein VFT26_02930 [Pyrinomonadaceae bacterium]|nr:hypothetical protein [Pyrinomonadaceae bacterium]
MIDHAFLLLLLFTTLLQGPNCGCEQKPEINVLAVVNGVKITRKDLSIDTQTQVSLAQDAVMVARSRQLELKINDLLLEVEAKRRGITTAKLIELEVTAKVTPPTEAEAKAVYEQNNDRTQSFSSVKDNILARLMTERAALRVRVFASSLRAGATVTIANQQVTPPTNEAELARVFANVNGVNITSSDIETSLLPLIFQVQQQVYALRKRDLDQRINEILLEQEAKRLGTTQQALINQNVNAKVPIPTEDQARAVYNANKAQLNGDFSDLKARIMQYLMEQEQQKMLSEYAEQLRKESAVQIYLIEPKPPNLRQLCCNLAD